MTTQNLQKIFVAWFIILTMIALYNFTHNVWDDTAQKELLNSYKDNKDRYEQSIKEHEQFRKKNVELQSEVDYLKGRLDERKGER